MKGLELDAMDSAPVPRKEEDTSESKGCCPSGTGCALTPEADLLFLAAREGVSRGMLSAAREGVAERQDTERFVRQCRLQKTGPLVLRTLNILAEDGELGDLEEVRRALCADWRRWRRHRRRVMAAIAMVRETLAATGARYAFMRGIPFAERYYRRPQLRVCGDVDLLIPEKDRPVVEAALMEAGFRLHPCKALHEARVEYVGQTELRHPDLRMLVDVNWLFTGNGGIGDVSPDMALVWDRARQVDGAEWRLSPEDELLNHIRHLGHGHDFDTGMLQVCVDVAGMLRVCGSTMDWDYVHDQAERSECLRILRFFAHFFDTHYRDESMPRLGECMPRLSESASDRECRAFTRIVLLPLLRRRHSRRAAFGVVYGNFRIAAKLWALDRFTRMLRMLGWAAWPSKHQLTMITLEYQTESVWRRRIRYYLVPLLPGLPGLCIGVAARVASQGVVIARRVLGFFARSSRSDADASEAESDTAGGS
jgi:putative nucleotidyltransferase-like protein